MTQEQTNSTEFQEYKNAVLKGINWSARAAHDNTYGDTQLVIGQVDNYQIYLSESPNLKDEQTGVRTYTMSLWSMNTRTKHLVTPDDRTVVVTRPGYTQLIEDMLIIAGDMDEAKLSAVQAILKWNDLNLDTIKAKCEQTLQDAQEQHNRLTGVFNNMDAVLSDKIKTQKSADSIKTLRISTMTTNALTAANIHVIGELANMTVKDLKTIKGIGSKSVQEILFAMKSLGIIMEKS